MIDSRKILLVIYTFPPLGGSGVQRAVKFCKYLPLNNIKVNVLTVKDILYHVYDPSLMNDVDKSVNISRTHSLDPLRIAYLIKSIFPSKKNVQESSQNINKRKTLSLRSRLTFIYRYISKIIFFIDPQILWTPFAMFQGWREVKKKDIDVIVSMSQPNSLIYTCFLLSKWTKKPLILDMRDPWLNDPYFKTPTSLHLTLYKKIEKMAFQRAQSLVVISQSMKDAIRKTHPELVDKVKVIPNGFDSEDLEESLGRQSNNQTIFTYTGSLYFHHESILQLFINAVELAIKKDATLPQKMKIRFIGNVEESNKIILNESPISEMCYLSGYVNHQEALSYTIDTDVLLLFIKPELSKDTDTITIPGKFFEYIGSKNPILFLGPECETSDIINLSGQGWCPTLTVEEISDLIVKIVNKEVEYSVNQQIIDQYDRKVQAKEFAKIIHHLT